MADINVLLGIVGWAADGDYDPYKEYSKGKLVFYGGGSYLYTYPNPDTGVPLTDTSHWQQIASVGGQDLVDAAVAARDAAQGYAAQLAAGLLRPKGAYADLAALNAGTPTVADTDEIYITLDDGKWCYHNGTAWVAGGQFQAASVSADIGRLNDIAFGLTWTSGYVGLTGGDKIRFQSQVLKLCCLPGKRGYKIFRRIQSRERRRYFVLHKRQDFYIWSVSRGYQRHRANGHKPGRNILRKDFDQGKHTG